VACQVCNEHSGFYPLCKKHFAMREHGTVVKCIVCDRWVEGNDPICRPCWPKATAEQKSTARTLKASAAQSATSPSPASATVAVAAPPAQVQVPQPAAIVEVVSSEEKSFRDAFPPTHRAEDGHVVRSRAELLIDNWLFHKGIVHAYEKRVPIDAEMYCDFFIPIGDKVYIECWGLEDDPRYRARKEKKIGLYKSNEKKLVEITSKDIEHLDDVMPQKLRPYLPKTFSFD